MTAVLVVMALLAAACAGSDVESPSTSEATLSAGSAKAMVDEALGGTQAVQDFLIHIDMSVQTESGEVSYYQEVLDQAAAGASEPIALAGGLTFRAVDSLEGHVVGPDGEDLDTVALDFGLLSALPQHFAAAQALLVESLAGTADPEVLELIAAASDSKATMLVELVTPDYARLRTHVGPGDLAAVDLTFVTALAPGDTVTSVYLFGQTLPGDPAAEAELSPHQLFAYRWNLGLVRVLGADEGLGPIVDETVSAVEGSTITMQEVKAFAASLVGAVRGRQIAEDLISQPVIRNGGLKMIPDRDGSLVFFDDDRCGGCGSSDSVLAKVDPALFTLYAMARTAVMACLDLLPRLIMDNQAELASRTPPEHIEDSEFEDTAIDDIVDGRDPEVSLGDLCGVPKPRPRPATGGTFSDVHLRTFDGWDYDNQAAGEFLVFDNEVATVQLRTEPWPDSDAVSIAVAVAVGIGDHRVSMHHGGGLWIDDVRTDLSRGETIAVGDAAVLWTGTGWVVVWPDGTEVRVSNAVQQTLLFVTPSDLPSVGMLGSADGDGSNDWVTRSGEQLDSEIRFDFEAFYPTYIDTWRIDQEESLFHYGPGESTGTFSIEGFPLIKYDLDDLDPTERADAEQACRNGGVERADMVRDCVLDVVLTGDESFIYDTYVAQSSLSALPSLGEAERGANSVTVGPLAVDFGPDPAVFIPDTPVEWVCQGSEGSFDAFSEFQESTGRLISVSIGYRDAQSSGTGEEQVTIVVLLNRRAYAWVQAGVDPSAGTLDDLSLNGRTLTARGAAFLNDPIDFDLNQGFPLPEGAALQPFSLAVTCDQ